jgi:hypothetical protein
VLETVRTRQLIHWVVLATALFLSTTASNCRWRLSINSPVTGSSTLIITTVTTGSSIDVDGYTLGVRSGDQDATVPRTIRANDSQSLQLDPDAVYVVTLGGLATNCGVVGANPRNIQLARDATVQTEFQVACLRTGP